MFSSLPGYVLVLNWLFMTQQIMSRIPLQHSKVPISAVEAVVHTGYWFMELEPWGENPLEGSFDDGYGGTEEIIAETQGILFDLQAIQANLRGSLAWTPRPTARRPYKNGCGKFAGFAPSRTRRPAIFRRSRAHYQRDRAHGRAGRAHYGGAGREARRATTPSHDAEHDAWRRPRPKSLWGPTNRRC